MPKATLTIILDDDGKPTVNGPIDNKLLCYGLLEVARQLIQAYDPVAARNGILLAKGPLPNRTQ